MSLIVTSDTPFIGEGLVPATVGVFAVSDQDMMPGWLSIAVVGVLLQSMCVAVRVEPSGECGTIDNIDYVTWIGNSTGSSILNVRA